MWNSSIFRYLSGATLAASLTGCSLLLGLSDKQCNADSECVDAQLGDTCIDHICSYADCQGAACYANDAGVGRCDSDKQCSGTSTPRCFKSSCVSTDVYMQWSCDEEKSASTETVTYGFRVVDFLSKEPPQNVVVNACRNSDVACAQPVATFTDTQATGDASFELPLGFYGFFEIRSAQVPALLYVTKPIVQDTRNRDVPVLTTSTVDLLATLAGFPFDAEKGLALLEALDCTGIPAGGVQFKTSRGSADQFYIIDQVPSKDATLTEFDETDSTADGGFINLDPGFITFSAFLGLDGIELGSFNAQIRANTITYIDMNF